MKFDILRANERGHLNFGWLDTYHSFSFGEYQNRKRMNFGALRVINDDTIAPQSMFPPHSHQDMEIITLVLEGSIEHQDNLGNKTIIRAGEIQTMSAGSGIQHSEANPSAHDTLRLFQIWIYPRQKNLTPSYAQRNFSQQLTTKNQWHYLISPITREANILQINQEAYLALGEFDSINQNFNYVLNNPQNGVLIMLISGELIITKQTLHERDAIMFTEYSEINFTPSQTSKLLVIEVPLIF